MDLFQVRVVNRTVDAVTFAFIGHMTRAHLDTTEDLLSQAKSETASVSIDLRSLQLLDREAACFLRRWEERGIQIIGCLPFVARWVSQCPPD